MYVKTKPLIKWPDRDVLRLTMPTSFCKFFKKCDVITDSSEVFVERPSDLMARAQVWSNYKHHSTIKFLIGITPQGTISYISKCAAEIKMPPFTKGKKQLEKYDVDWSRELSLVRVNVE